MIAIGLIGIGILILALNWITNEHIDDVRDEIINATKDGKEVK